MEGIDNTDLEELMKQDITAEMQIMFLEKFKESQLLMPVTFSENIFEGIEDAEVGDVIKPDGRVGFDINYLTDGDDNKAVPLFTSSEIMESVGVRCSVIGIFMSDLADMLKQTDKYAVISINPFTEFDLNMSVESFLIQFKNENDF